MDFYITLPFLALDFNALTTLFLLMILTEARRIFESVPDPSKTSIIGLHLWNVQALRKNDQKI